MHRADEGNAGAVGVLPLCAPQQEVEEQAPPGPQCLPNWLEMGSSTSLIQLLYDKAYLEQR